MRFLYMGLGFLALLPVLVFAVTLSQQVYLLEAQAQVSTGWTRLLGLRMPGRAAHTSVSADELRFLRGEQQDLVTLAAAANRGTAPFGLTALNSEYQAVLNEGSEAGAQLIQAVTEGNLTQIQQVDQRLQQVLDRWNAIQRRINDVVLGNWIILLVSGSLVVLGVAGLIHTGWSLHTG